MTTLIALLQELLNPWILIGFFGQFIFFMRFIIQWLVSEKKKAVVVPLSFWYLSIFGSFVILAYSIHIKDIVFITAQILSIFIYVRNLMLQNSFTKTALETAQSAVSESDSTLPS